MLEFESRVRIRTEMTDVGQGRHYLFTPEMTALRPNFRRCRRPGERPKADEVTNRLGRPNLGLSCPS